MNPKSITIGNESAGIKIEYIKRRNVIYISGWYDSIVGIEGKEIPLEEFCERLGIGRKKRTE